ncbi:MAG: hypothetical protein AB1422_02870 [bacterium]
MFRRDRKNIFRKDFERKIRNNGKRSGGVTKGDVEIKEIGRYY